MSAASPSIMDLLASLHGGGGPQGGPGGPPPGPPQGGDEGGGDPVPDLLKQAIDALHQAFAAENEPIDKQAIAKALAAVQAILATEQKEKDQAMGGGNMRILRRGR